MRNQQQFAPLLLTFAALAATSSGYCEEPKTPPASATKPAAAKEKDRKPPAGKPLFDGKTMTGWKVTEFGGQGEVEVKDGNLVLGMGEGCTGITWKGEFPKTDYEVTVDAMRVDGVDFFCGMTFTVGESPCSLIVGGWGGSIVGLSSIDGQDAANNQTTRFEKFEKGRWYRVRVRVTKEKIVAWIDDKQVVEQPLEGHKLSVRPEVELSRPFGLCSWNTTAAIREVRVRTLEAKP